MAAVETTLRSPDRVAPATGQAARGAPALTRWFAAFGAVMVVWMGWTLISWIASGDVHQITAYRDHAQTSWIAAHVYEVVFAVLTLALIVHVVREAVRRRCLTLDAMLLLALFSASWLDPAFNYYKQIFLYSSQFVNVGAWCGHMPGILNGECGRMPEPLVIPLLYMQVLLAAMIACRLVAGAQARASSWSVGRTVLLAGAFGVVFDFVMEMPSLGLHLWSYASGPDGLAPPGLRGASRYSLTTAFTFGLICASVSALRYHRNDRGESLLEQRSSGPRTPARAAIVLLAVIGWVQLTVIASFAPAMLAAPYAGSWPSHLPRPLVNGLCDNNSRGPTPYPCSR